MMMPKIYIVSTNSSSCYSFSCLSELVMSKMLNTATQLTSAIVMVSSTRAPFQKYQLVVVMSITPSHSQLMEINTYHTNIILIPLTIKHSHIHCVGLNITESERAIQCKPEENKHFLFFCNLIKTVLAFFYNFKLLFLLFYADFLFL